MRRLGCGLPARHVRVLGSATRLAVLAERPDVELAALARRLVLVGSAPRIERNRLLQIRAVPLRLVLRPLQQRGEALLGARIATDVQAIGVERLLERDDLRLRGLDL